MREATRAAIATAVASAWAGNTLPIVWENQPDPKQATSSWARVGITFGKGIPAAVGGDYDRLPGILWMQLFIPDKKGTKPALQAADALEAAVCKTRLTITGTGWAGAVQFDQAASGPEEAGTKDGYTQRNCRVGFLVHRFTI